MKTRATLALTAVAGLAAGALGQNPSFTSDTDITVHLTWREANSSGGTVPSNGILEPGEFALIQIDSVSFTNFGSTANFSPSIGTWTSGLITGFASGFLDINGVGGTNGSFNNSSPQANAAGTTGFGVRSTWRLNGNGTVNPASDGIINQQFGQFPANPGGANSTNPIVNMFRMLWQPSSFAGRTVTFNEAPAAISAGAVAGVYLDFDGGAGGPGSGTVGASVFVTAQHLHLNGVNIPISPAPSSLALLGLGGLVAGRRRR
jgi:hypothetical protein